MFEAIQIRPNTLPEKPSEVFSQLRDFAILELDRRDSAACAAIPCDLARINILRKRKLGSHELAVVTGAFISPQCRNKYKYIIYIYINIYLREGDRRDLPLLPT